MVITLGARLSGMGHLVRQLRGVLQLKSLFSPFSSPCLLHLNLESRTLLRTIEDHHNHDILLDLTATIIYHSCAQQRYCTFLKFFSTASPPVQLVDA